MTKEETISRSQLLTLIVMTQIGISALSLTHALAEVSGSDSWIAALLAGVTIQAGIVLIWWLGKRYPARHFFCNIHSIVGKPIGSVLNVLYGCFYILTSLVITISYTDILCRWVLLRTPWWLVLLMLFLICSYAATSSLRRIANVSQAFTIILVICYLMICFGGSRHWDIRNLLPILSGGSYPILKGMVVAYSAYFGYDLLLYAYPYVESRSSKKILLTMTYANALSILFYVTVSLVSTLSFSNSQLVFIPEPIVFILKQYQTKVLQSLDLLFIIMYISITSVTIIVYLFMAAKAFLHVNGTSKGKHTVWVWIATGIGYSAGCYVWEKQWIKQTTQMLHQLCFVFMVIIPFLLLCISAMRGRRQ
ncbi:GerAB/ArcD/ProY family transporter [Paenibacillus sp. BC26]|uniref:GerAB/ArcD/ProY family transporter n=1 Tax=Paenibacillus sp. BC26 TaxID=1881032 RepID=UPI0008EF8325|nr:GerAB/ArcD/ProY family transporter [Paenibacillus sp. BC26]SFS45920.1 spore germination protein (amino acid permease) [Paenibacillus sp. BC26]